MMMHGLTNPTKKIHFLDGNFAQVHVVPVLRRISGIFIYQMLIYLVLKKSTFYDGIKVSAVYYLGWQSSRVIS